MPIERWATRGAPSQGWPAGPVQRPPLPTLLWVLGILSQFFLETQTSSQVHYSAAVSGGHWPGQRGNHHLAPMTSLNGTFGGAGTRQSDVGKLALRRLDSADGEGAVSRSSPGMDALAAACGRRP